MSCNCGYPITVQTGNIENCCTVSPRPGRPNQPGYERWYLLAEAEPENGIGLAPVVTEEDKILIYID